MIFIYCKMSIWRYLFREVKTVKLEKIAKTHFYAFWLWKTSIWQEKNANSISFSWKREPCQFDEIKKSKKASKNHPYLVATKLALLLRACASVFAHLFLSRWHNHNNSWTSLSLFSSSLGEEQNHGKRHKNTKITKKWKKFWCCYWCHRHQLCSPFPPAMPL